MSHGLIHYHVARFSMKSVLGNADKDLKSSSYGPCTEKRL